MESYSQKIMELYNKWTDNEITSAEFIEKYLPLSRRLNMQMQRRIDHTNERLNRTEEKIEELMTTLQETEIALGIAYAFIQSKGLDTEYQIFMNRQIDDIANELLSLKVH